MLLPFRSSQLLITLQMALLLGLASGAHAQDIEEVIIEAVRQDDSTLDVTESVDLFDLEDLETKQIKGFADIANNVPGLTGSPSGAQGLRFTLRGIGARDSQLGIESKVGLYVDGAFLGRASGLVFDIVDLENVEVLKGPQGFTYGRNAIGGAINLITAKAKVDEFSARLETKLGNFNRRNVTGIVNVPISETFALRAAAFINDQDGWVENTGRGEDWGGYSRNGFRVSGRWYASDTVTVDYSYDQADFETQPVFYQMQYREGEDSFDRNDYERVAANIGIFGTTDDSTRPALFTGAIGPDRVEEGNASIRDIELSTTEADGHSLVVEWAWSDAHTFKFIGTHRTSDVNDTFYFFPEVSSQPAIAEAINAFAPTIIRSIQGDELFFPDPDPATGGDTCLPNALVMPPVVGFLNLSLLGISEGVGTAAGALYNQQLRNAIENPLEGPPFGCAADFALTPNLFTLVGAAGEPYRIRNQLQSAFSSPPGGLASLRDHKQFSLEFQQSGSFLDDRLTYLGGLYYFNERTGNGRPLGIGSDGVLDFETDLYLDFIEFLDFGAVSQDPDDLENFGFSFVSINEIDTDHIGVYTNWTYTPLWFDERMEFDFGLRYSYDKRNLFRQGLQAIALVPRGAPELESDTWESLDPRIKLSYQVTEEIVGYVSLTSGYRSGNFNVDAREVPTQAGFATNSNSIKFEAESQIAYEVGAKGSLLDGLVEAELAYFYYDIKDGQETVIFPTCPICRAVVNADGFAYGFESDFKFYLTEELTLSASYALLRSGSDEYISPFGVDASEIVADLGRPLDPVLDTDLYRRFVLPCSGGLRTPNFERGLCLERKSNFGAPVNSWDVGLEYRLPTDFGELYMNLGYSYKDPFFVNDTLKVDARNIWNLRVQAQFETNAGVARVALWSQNLFDNEYQLQKFELNATAIDIASYGPPRTFGIDIIHEWY